jgi:uncharacterized protein YjbI with pentapeptide repeats
MKREAAWEHFVANYAQTMGTKKLLALEEYFYQHWDELIAEFQESFREICLKIKAMQAAETKGKVACITYSMLRTAISNQKPVYLVEAFDQEWFLDSVECQTSYQASWAFQFLDQLGTELAEQVKSLHLYQIDRPRLERYQLQEAKKYHRYIIRLARHALLEAVKLSEFQAIATEADFAVRIGEYLDISEVVYKESRRIKDLVAAKKPLSEIAELAYTNNALTGLSLTHGDYYMINLEHVALQGSDLSDSQMQYSNLTGAKFNRGALARTNLKNAWIYEADFSECNLAEANFTNAVGAAGLSKPEEWQEPGFRAVNFRGANLEGANFKDAKLRGASFVGANLTNVNFAGADLERAVFAKSDSDRLNLDEKQQTQIIWI